MSKESYFYKTIICGDGGVGKSTMVQRLVTGNFIPQKITIGTDLATYDINFDHKEVKLQIWDFAGEARFRFFLPNYARGAVGCLLCYDITQYKSYENLTEWLGIVRNNASNPVIILVGGKRDLADTKRAVNYQDGEKFKEEHNLEYFFETSSKSGHNNKVIFRTLAQEILEKKQD
ncbi:MAG: GTP-binding protein [Promethearchaeia archaeon]